MSASRTAPAPEADQSVEEPADAAGRVSAANAEVEGATEAAPRASLDLPVARAVPSELLHEAATTNLGVLIGPGDGAGHDAPFYGTDLGYTYEHRGKLHILFGDTWEDEGGTLVGGDTLNDDSAGIIDCLRGGCADTYLPDVKLRTASGRVQGLAYSHASDALKTPMAGFSNGTDEYALFFTGKPLGCRQDADCGEGLSCDNGLGFFGEEYYDEKGLTGGCIDGTPGCLSDTMADGFGLPVPGSGFCVDRTSSQYQDSATGRPSAIAIRVHVGVRADDGTNHWESQEWLTSKFQNVTARVGQIDGVDKVLLWGRPGFAAVGARGRRADLYFAYADMPNGRDFTWTVHYLSGFDGGEPVFSTDPSEAVSVLEAERDVVNQQSVVYVEELDRWVMLYGGGVSKHPLGTFVRCGVLEVLVGPECNEVEVDSGSIRMRIAQAPWGPWSEPTDVLVGGNPADGAVEQYGPGGILRHPGCVGATCAPHSDSAIYGHDEYGFLYGANIIEGWTVVRESGAVDLHWNVSAWDPYNVVLLRTRLTPEVDEGA